MVWYIWVLFIVKNAKINEAIGKSRFFYLGSLLSQTSHNKGASALCMYLHFFSYTMAQARRCMRHLSESLLVGINTDDTYTYVLIYLQACLIMIQIHTCKHTHTNGSIA